MLLLLHIRLEIMEEERKTDDIDTTATDHSCGHRCHIYLISALFVMMATIKLMTSTQLLGTID
jgi:hypothetical protein